MAIGRYNASQGFIDESAHVSVRRDEREVKQRGVPFAILGGDGVIMARFRVTLNSQDGWDATKITYCNTVQEAGQE